LDLRQFFDEVNHDVLMARLGRKVKDKRLKRLINAYLQAGVISRSGGYDPTEKGTPQGGPLSPLLSNILLDDLDKELEKRGHCFCRYCDDCNIYVATRRAGQRVMRSITAFIEGTLKLKVNDQKSAVARPWARKFLGFSTQKVFGKMRTSVPKETLFRLRSRLKLLFREGRGRNMGRFINERLNPVLRGWLQYFWLGTSRRQLITLDFWIRRRLRCIMWRQWKRPSTRLRKFRGLGLNDDRAYTAFSRKGPWSNAGSPAMRQALPPEYFRSLGLYLLTDSFAAMRKTST
jgi:RNA-directed DNA polymerase